MFDRFLEVGGHQFVLVKLVKLLEAAPPVQELLEAIAAECVEAIMAEPSATGTSMAQLSQQSGGVVHSWPFASRAFLLQKPPPTTNNHTRTQTNKRQRKGMCHRGAQVSGSAQGSMPPRSRSRPAVHMFKLQLFKQNIGLPSTCALEKIVHRGVASAPESLKRSTLTRLPSMVPPPPGATPLVRDHKNHVLLRGTVVAAGSRSSHRVPGPTQMARRQQQRAKQFGSAHGVHPVPHHK